MAFLTPCFVRVEDPEERHKLIEWLEGIGYIFNDCFIGARECAVSKYLKQFYVIAGDPHISRMCKALDAKPEYGNYIDAGTSIELFKALAAMNNESCLCQWFTDGHNWGLCEDKYWAVQVAKWDVEGKDDMLEMAINPQCHNATAEEIVEYFKKK